MRGLPPSGIEASLPRLELHGVTAMVSCTGSYHYNELLNRACTLDALVVSATSNRSVSFFLVNTVSELVN